MYKKIYSFAKENLSVYAGITTGALMMGAGLSIFLVPFMIAPGGISGLSTLLHHLTGIRVSTLIILINAPIFALGYANFDIKFLAKSVYGTFALSAATEIFAHVPLLTNDVLLASAFGGAVMGCGIGTVMKFGGTTGGTDILALVIRKYAPQLSIGQLFLAIDGAIILIAGAVSSDWEVILYSGATLFISSRVPDALLEGVNFARLVYIISNRNLAITQAIYANMNRGVTALSSVSMYTGKTGRILICVIRKYELPKLKRIVYSIDSNAFVIISDAKEVTGNGFGSYS